MFVIDLFYKGQLWIAHTVKYVTFVNCEISLENLPEDQSCMMDLMKDSKIPPDIMKTYLKKCMHINNLRAITLLSDLT